ncbi:hypothetical protein JCM21900_005549 [Sporobolomyces salmonicolor]
MAIPNDPTRQRAAAERLASVTAHLARSPSTSSATSSRGESTPLPNLKAALAALSAILPPDQLSFDLTTRTAHASTFGSFLPPSPASVVVHALSTQDVVSVVNIATQHRIVMIPTGGRTSLEGQHMPTCCNPPEEDKWGGARRAANAKGELLKVERPTIHLSLSRMNRVLKVYEEDFQAIVEPGVGWQSLNQHLAERGSKLFYPIDPAPGAEFGGMVGVGGSGTNTVGYGTMRAEWITSLEVVLMDGSVIRTKGTNRARKSSTGWDTARLFLGSEGTLGIITQLTVRLAPVLPLKVALTSFPTVSSAVHTSTSILRRGLSPTSLELLDGTSIRGLNLANLLPGEEKLRERPTVLMRFSGANEETMGKVLEEVRGIVMENGGEDLRVAIDEEENDVLWKARKSQYWSQQLLVGEGCRTLITDVCVPLSRLAEFVDRSDTFVGQSGLLAPIVAHIGDGNVHRAILFKGDPKSIAPPPEVEELAKKLALLAIELEGTCAGEHGIGLTKRGYLKRELGEGTLDLMRRIKSELDPLNLLNPGKILFEEGGEVWK